MQYIKFALFFVFGSVAGFGLAQIQIQREIQVVSVYDGDTFKINLPNEPAIFGHEISVRIRGIDTPEIRGGTVESKAAAIKARDFLEGMLAGNVITLHNMGRDKYFRILADVRAGGVDVADKMLKSGLAKIYDGGTKE